MRIFHTFSWASHGLATLRKAGGSRLLLAAVAVLGLVGVSAVALAQSDDSGPDDQQARCMQLQQELASVQAGGGSSRQQLPMIDQQIANLQRVARGTEASMEDASCFQSFFIFGRSVVRTPRCLSMNGRLEDAHRQLRQLQDQRDAIASGRSDQSEISDLQDALSRNGCAGAPQRSGGGGLFDWFGGGNDNTPSTGLPISTSILPNTPYRTVCVRLCDGFYYPISYSAYSSAFSHDANQCQSTCAAPAELYVYQNPGQKMEQAISLNGQPYVDLPVAFKFRKQYLAGCSCKQSEYNPTEIATDNAKQADAGKPGAKGNTGSQGGSGDQDNSNAQNSSSGATAPAADSSGTSQPAGQNGAPLNLDIDPNTLNGGGGTAPASGGSGGNQSNNAPLSPAAVRAQAILNGNGDGGSAQPSNGNAAPAQ